ncbi:MAG: hypothetical protein D6704_09015 [Nitrospirae bacterium]|nr:MAG: hypothetical protein D6704_09015 [Nitrospirota bacterium]
MPVSGNIAAMGEALLAQAREEAQHMLAAAQQEAEVLMQATEEEAQQIVSAAISQAEAEAKLEAQRRIAAAEVEAARVIIRAREAVIQQATDRLVQQLHALPHKPDYVTVLEQLLREAVTGLGRPELYLQVRKVDCPLVTEEWLKQMGDELGVSLHRHPEPVDISGGLIVSTPDRRLTFDQSFNALLHRHADVLRAIMAQVLWGPQQANVKEAQDG